MGTSTDNGWYNLQIWIMFIYQFDDDNLLTENLTNKLHGWFVYREEGFPKTSQTLFGWANNKWDGVPQILWKATPQILDSDFFLLLDQLLY